MDQSIEVAFILVADIVAEASRAFGNTTLIKEQTHEAWGWTWIDRLFQDLRYGLGLLRKSPSLGSDSYRIDHSRTSNAAGDAKVR
jgi:hypothetical protein